jgi:S1-C subfamily serine protease
VTSARDFGALYEEQRSGALVPFTVLRAGQVVRGRVVQPGRDCRPVQEPIVLSRTGVTLRPPASPAAGVEVIAVAAGGPAERAALRAGDRVLEVGGPNAARADALLAFLAFERRPRPLLLSVRRGDRARLLALSPDAH